MSDQSDNTNPQRRRMSLVDMFSAKSSLASSPPNAGVPSTPDAAQHRRGTSISARGLTTQGPGQASPYNAFAKQRRASISTSTASSSPEGRPEFRNSFGDEPAVIEEDEMSKSSYVAPSSPTFARRVSFGAQALRDVRQGGPVSPNGGRRSSSSLYALSEDSNHSAQKHSRSPETAKAGGEGFNWSEALRDRTKRSSFSSGNPFSSGLNRAKSTSAVAAVEPPKEMPKPMSPPAKLKKPDHLGERMLRGDFMMD